MVFVNCSESRPFTGSPLASAHSVDHCERAGGTATVLRMWSDCSRLKFSSLSAVTLYVEMRGMGLCQITRLIYCNIVCMPFPTAGDCIDIRDRAVGATR